MELHFCPLYSGSSGNALYCGYGDTHLLIDAGLSGRTIIGALSEIGVNPGRINALLITHEHSDHISGAGVLARRLGVPIYANAGTWAAMERRVGRVPASQVRLFTTGEDFYIGDINVMPFKTPHDAAESVGYLLESHGRSVGIATDIGHITKGILEHLRQADIALLESNHDLDMLRVCGYPQMLKNRISGQRGHLSNADCARTLVELREAGVSTAILGHLSGEANTPEVAMNTSREVLRGAGIDPDADISLQLAHRHEIGRLCRVL